MIRFIERDEVARRLTYEVCIPIIRDAMKAVSLGETRQLLREIISLAGEHKFAVMPGAMAEDGVFGAKIVSVFPENVSNGIQSHQGLVVLFEPERGAPVCVVHAGEITAIRTAAASAVATDALARREAGHLALLGYGEQALNHAMAISKVRALKSITVWGRSPEKSKIFKASLQTKLNVPVDVAPTVLDAVTNADIICTVSAAREPILKAAWVSPGTHINVVGSSYAGPAEIDNDLVVNSRFIADYREGILAQGAEFLNAKAAGLIDDDHIVGEIGEVLLGHIPGRENDTQLTIYKSIGHIIQDLAPAWTLYTEKIPTPE